ncbi:RimK/LysX family protein [Aquisalimonas lutea]|uniref:ATP-dependent zinc protease family protein n=1 Tax=Aquisalimonas lutea TaxID=1327750 RepID=UPI0025B489BB|nr:RimK/LysX family protein [Aquisalimonas lutea]MDN3517160.1 RimK/LysX family protein [Aquisalimonas lutea]
MRRCFRVHVLLIAFLATMLAAGTVHSHSVFGWVERVKVIDADLVLKSKLDTAAETSSIHAPDPEAFEKDGEDWVRFEISNEDGTSVTLERPVERTVRIRSASGVTERYVVNLTVCVGRIQQEREVNLADREELSTPMLLGRNFMEGVILVDPAEGYTEDPACGQPYDQDDDDDDGEDDDDD